MPVLESTALANLHYTRRRRNPDPSDPGSLQKIAGAIWRAPMSGWDDAYSCSWLNEELMKETLNSAVAQMPHTIAQGAPSMIGRIIEAMQTALARDVQLPNIAYCSLLLKLGATDMAREFLTDLTKAAAYRGRPKAPSAPPSDFGLLLEPMGTADPSVDTMHRSTELFARVLAKAAALGIRGLEPYGKEFFLGPLREAMVKARIDEENIVRMMPYACRALDAELVRLYERLDSVS